MSGEKEEPIQSGNQAEEVKRGLEILRNQEEKARRVREREKELEESFKDLKELHTSAQNKYSTEAPQIRTSLKDRIKQLTTANTPPQPKIEDKNPDRLGEDVLKGFSHPSRHATNSTTATSRKIASTSNTPQMPADDAISAAIRSRLEQLLYDIEKTPEAQIKLKMDAEQKIKDNSAVKLSHQTSVCAAEYPGGLIPAEVKDGPNTEKDASRKIYHVEPTQEGPIFMPRKMPDGTTLSDGDPPKIIYDMIWYEGEPLKFKPEKSFIAPDGHPNGSLASVPCDLREECWKYHNDKFEGKNRVTTVEATVTAVISSVQDPRHTTQPTPSTTVAVEAKKIGRELKELSTNRPSNHTELSSNKLFLRNANL